MSMNKKKKDESQAVNLAKKVIEASGGNFNQWCKDVIERRHYEVYKSLGTKWETEVLEEEAVKLITAELEKMYM